MAPKKVPRKFKSVEYIEDSDSEEENDTVTGTACEPTGEGIEKRREVDSEEEEENDTGTACEPTGEGREKRRELEGGVRARGSKKYIVAHVRIKDLQACTREEENDTGTACEPTGKGREKRRELEGGVRARGSKKYIGAHVRIKDGIWKAVQDCRDLGGRSFALFLGSQRAWKRPPLNPTAVAKFQEQCQLQGFDPAHILPHGSYLMNCGSPKLDVFAKSQALLIDELGRCNALGLHLYNFHPGSSLGTITTAECVEKIAGAINHAHQQVPTVVTVIENMCGQGQTVGGKFSELRDIIDRVRDQTRVAVCLDTCHAFAAGYDLAAEQGVKTVLDEFDQTVGLHYLKALHLNDSKGALGCHLDRHEDIGMGNIGIAAFRDIVNEPRLDNIPMILETPERSGFEYPEQIKLLYSLCDTE